MSLITAHNVGKSFGAVTVFHGVSGSVPSDGRIALVGPNGVGKTTLLRILCGLEQPSAGRLQRARTLRMGYLPQEAVGDGVGTLWDACLSVFDDLRAQERRLAAVEQRLSARPHDQNLLETYGRLQSEFEHNGGYSYETRIQQTLSGLGFTSSDHTTELAKLSGGQQTRARLAQLLLERPDLLVLDEPTNHLDIQAVEWLEGCLRAWKGAILIVSHDRAFLDRVVDHVWELHSLGLETFRGNYSAYVDQREARRADRARHIAAEKERLEKDLAFARKHLAGSLTTQAHGRLRRASRTIRAIEDHGFEGVRGRRWLEVGRAERPMRIDEASRRLKALAGTDRSLTPMKPSIRPRRRGGNIILTAAGARIGFPERLLLRIDRLILQRRERVAILGGNGSGKTTLLRTLRGELPALGGELRLGEHLDLGYFAQAHEDLDPRRSLIEEIQSADPRMLPAEVRSHLDRFRFSGDEQFKKVSALSGGERGRLALAKLARSDANVLLLDEPTNHLDLLSQEVLQQMLTDYEGTILLVSHDRYLIGAVATQIWSIDDAARRLLVFEGFYAEFIAHEQQTDKGARA